MKIADARSKPSLGSVGRAPTLAQAQCTATVRAVLFQVRLRTSCAGKARRRGSTRADGWRRGRLRRALRGPGGTRRRRCSLRGPTTGTTRAGCCPCPLTSAWPACWSCCRSPACRCELAPRPPPAPPPVRPAPAFRHRTGLPRARPSSWSRPAGPGNPPRKQAAPRERRRSFPATSAPGRPPAARSIPALPPALSPEPTVPWPAAWGPRDAGGTPRLPFPCSVWPAVGLRATLSPEFSLSSARAF